MILIRHPRKVEELVLEPEDSEANSDDINHTTKHTSVLGFKTFNSSPLPTKENPDLLAPRTQLALIVPREALEVSSNS